MKRSRPAQGMVPALLFPLCACLLLCLPGCVPTSRFPLTDRDPREADPGLMGDWFHREKEEVLHLHVGRGKLAGSLRLVLVEVDSDGLLDLTRWTGHVSRLGQDRFLNLIEVPPETESPGYIFVKYRVAGDRLCLSLASNKGFEEAVRSGRLRGIVEEAHYGNTVTVTEEQAGLQRFVRENLRDLFPEESCMTRLSLPESPSQAAGM